MLLKRLDIKKIATKFNTIQNTDGSNWVTIKNWYDKKISEIENKINYHDHAKYVTNQEFNKLTSKSFASRLA